MDAINRHRSSSLLYYYKNRDKGLMEKRLNRYYEKRVDVVIDFSVEGQPFEQVNLSRRGRLPKYF